MTRDDVLWKRVLRRVWAVQLRVGPNDTRQVRVRHAALTSPRPAAVDALLETAPTDRHRDWVLRAAAAGAADATLVVFADRISGMGARELARALDPLSQPRGALRQQSATTCGSASLVVARMLTDPVYALLLLDGFDARTGEVVGGDVGRRFAGQEQQVKGRTNGIRGATGRLALPWPHRLGTPPWGAREEMDAWAGVAGTRHRVLRIDSDSAESRMAAWRLVVAAVQGGHPCPVYVGDAAVPRHVVLALGTSGDSLTIYEPSAGGPATVARSDLVDGRVDIAGWNRPWAVVIPSNED